MHPSLRRRLKAVSHHTARLITDVSYFFAGSGGKTPILVYHRVCPLDFGKGFHYGNVRPEEFDRQMAYLKDNFRVVKLTEYMERLENGRLSGDEACVTFDDGFRDNYLYAFEILKKHRLKATFFLVTKYIGTDILFPWMTLDDRAREDIRVNRERWLPLSWEDVREMMKYGMEFGTHTHTHRVSLSRMSQEEAGREIEESTRAFKEKTGASPSVFSYPHGTFKDYDGRHIEMLKAHGYRAAVTTNTGRNGGSEDPFRIRRIIVYEGDTMREFKKKVSGAYDILAPLQRTWLNIAGA